MALRMARTMVTGRFARRADLWSPVTTRFRVAPTDLDVLRHMNNGKYLSTLDAARMDLYTRTRLWPVLARRGWYPVVAAQTIEYRRSLLPFERFTVTSRFVGVDTRNAYLEHVFRAGQDECARAFVAARFLSRRGGSITPAELAGAVPAFGAGPTVPPWLERWAGDLRASLPTVVRGGAAS
ncbi:acyl-CoA thioesterase [Actinokineospora bangkokensis]|nr:acyl-CoA thioesterase [Actinokineospora bangkokensis]